MRPVTRRATSALIASVLLLSACAPETPQPASAAPSGQTQPSVTAQPEETPAATFAPSAPAAAATGQVAGGSGATGAVLADGPCAAGAGGSVADGWVRTVAPGWLQLDGPSLRVELHYAFELDDTLRSGIMSDNIWNRLLLDRYSAGRATSGGEAFVSPYYTDAEATESATGRSVYTEVVEEPDSGTVYPVAAIAPDEATLRAAFPTPRDLLAMHRYNYLPLSCGVWTGAWTTSSSSAAEAYSSSGSYLGIVVAASSVDLRLDPDGRYWRRRKAYVNNVATDETDTGSAAITSQGIVLTGDDGKTEAYDAAFLAVRAGFALFLQNREFSGDQLLFLPAR